MSPMSTMQQRLKSSLNGSLATSMNSSCDASLKSPLATPESSKMGFEDMLSPRRRREMDDARLKEQEWWLHTKRLKRELPPKFKFPTDPYAGQEKPEEKIRRQARSGEQQIADQVTRYQQHIEKMNQELDEKKQLEREQLKQQVPLFVRTAAFEEGKKQRKEVERNYQAWLSEMQTSITPQVPLRPVSAPGAELVLQKKREAAQAEQRKQAAEYKAWVMSVQKPSFVLPKEKVLTTEQRDALIMAQARSAREKATKAEQEYRAQVKEVDAKQQFRIEEAHRDGAAWRREYRNHIENKWVESKDRFANRQFEHAQGDASATAEMRQRVQSCPLLVEETLLPKVPGAGKSFPHRRQTPAIAAR